MALRPTAWREPAWAGRPSTRHSKRPTPLREVTTRPPDRAGSVTSAIGGAARKILDDRAGERAADLLVRGDEEDERPRRRAPRRHLPEGLEREERPALHVVDPRPVEPVALPPHRQVALDGAERVDGVEMGQEERRGLVPLGPRAQHQHVAEPLPAGDPLDRHRRAGEAAHHEVHHQVDAGPAVGRALGADPGEEGVEGAFGDVGGGHGGCGALLRWGWPEGRP